MKITTVTPADIRRALLLREIALLDLRHEAGFATGHPLFAANMAADRIAIEADVRLPRKNVPIVLYDDGEGLVTAGAERLAALGYTNVRALDGGLKAWRDAGYQMFEDVNSYPKPLASWSSRVGTRPRSVPTRWQNSSRTRPTLPSSTSAASTNMLP